MNFVHKFYKIQVQTIKQIDSRKNYSLLVILMMIFSLMMVNMISNVLHIFPLAKLVIEICQFIVELFGVALIMNALNLIVHFDELYIVNEIRLHDIFIKLLQLGLLYFLARKFLPKDIFHIGQIVFILLLPIFEMIYQEPFGGYHAMIHGLLFMRKHFFTWIFSNLPVAVLVVLVRWNISKIFPVISLYITKLVAILLLMIFSCIVLIYRANLYNILKKDEKNELG